MKRFLVWFFLSFQLWGAPRPVDRDELGRVERLAATLRADDRFRLFLAEDFEGKRPWVVGRSDSFLNQLELTAKTPGGEAFQKELALGPEFLQREAQGLTSLMFHTFSENPKLEHWKLSPKEPIVFPLGLPVAASLWVHSEGHHLRLKLILGQKKSQDLYWDMGELNFFGWRRIDLPIMLSQNNARLIQSFSLPIFFRSLRIDALPQQKKGAFVLYFDQLSFLIDRSTFHYSGSEIQDTWGGGR